MAVCTSHCAAQTPVWRRAEDGRVHVTVPGTLVRDALCEKTFAM